MSNTSSAPKPSPENCPEPFWHETHRYCPVCTWTEARLPVSLAPFDEWWRAKLADGMERSGTVPSVSAQEAFAAGWLAAVKAHDASGCPQIFMEDRR